MRNEAEILAFRQMLKSCINLTKKNGRSLLLDVVQAPRNASFFGCTPQTFASRICSCSCTPSTFSGMAPVYEAHPKSCSLSATPDAGPSAAEADDRCESDKDSQC